MLFSKIAEEVLRIIADPLIDSHDDLGVYLSELEQNLKEYDEGNTGFIKVDELASLLKTQYDYNLSKEEITEINRLFESRNGQQQIRYKDLINGIISINSDTLDENLNNVRELISLAKEQGIDFDQYFEEYDSNNSKNGLITLEEFSEGILALGVELDPFQISRLSSRFQVRNKKNEIRINYKKFLEKVLPQTADENVQLDVLDKLRLQARVFLQTCEVHDLWDHFESFDTTKTGLIESENLFKAFEIFHLDLSSIDRRRIIQRFADQEATETPEDNKIILLKYRDLLYNILNDNDGENDYKVLVSSNRFTDGSTDGIESSMEAANIEYVSDEELVEIIQSICKEVVSNFESLDLRDVFEQFDINFNGSIHRKEFLRCLRWLNVKGQTKGNITHQEIADTMLHNRLANRFSDDSSSDLVRYRGFLFQCLENLSDHREQYSSHSVRGLESNITELLDLIEKIRRKIQPLTLSGIDFQDSFRFMDREGSNLLSHHDFCQALASLGESVPVIQLSRMLSKFERQNMSDGSIKVNYGDFCELVRGNARLHEEYFPKYSLNNQEDGEQVVLTRFDACFQLRRLVSQTVKAELSKISAYDDEDKYTIQTVRRCFDDLDFNGDGIVEPSDLVEAFDLLNYTLSMEQADKVTNILLLFSGPFSPEEIITNKPVNSLLSFQAFLRITGYRHLNNKQRIKNKSSSDLIMDYDMLLCKRDESQVSTHEFLRNLIQVCKASKKDAYNIFERLDRDFSGFIDETEMAIALKEAFALELSEKEVYRLALRTDTLAAREKSFTGTGRINYRKFLCKAITEGPKLEMEDELLLTTLRESDTSLLQHRIYSRGDLIIVVCKLLKINESEYFNYPGVSKLVRSLEEEDGNIRVDEFYGSLLLNISKISMNSLKKGVSKHTKLFLAHFRTFDPNYTGLVQIDKENIGAVFSTISCNTTEGQEEERISSDVLADLSSDEVLAICRRFQVKIVPDGCSRQIDYRSLIRYFASTFDNENKTSVAGGAMPENERLEEGSSYCAHQNVNTWWKSLWKDNKKRELSKPCENSELAYRRWKVRKTWYEVAVNLLEELNDLRGDEEDSWILVGQSLVAVELYLQIVNIDVPSLRNNWIKWSKKSHRFEDIEVEGNIIQFLPFVNEPKGDEEKEDNLLYINLCKEQWKACERNLKSIIMIKHVEARKSGNSISLEKLLEEYGLNTLKSMIEEDKIKAEEKAEEEKKESLMSASRAHQRFVERKDGLRVIVPKFNANAKKKSASCSLDLELANNRNVIHASNKRDLEICRQKLVERGAIFEQNFKTEDGDLLRDEFLQAKMQKIQEKKIFKERRQLGSKQQYSSWCKKKNSTTLAIRYLKNIPAPNATAPPAKDKHSYWKQVGTYLKKVHPTDLFLVFVEWSCNFALENKCKLLWKSLEPKNAYTCSSEQWIWTHLRSILVKILSKPNVDFKEAFDEIVNKISIKSKNSSENIRQKMLRATEAYLFREMMHTLGFNLRLQDEKRLITGNRQTSSVCRESWRSDVTIKNENEIREASLEERLSIGLSLAGATPEFSKSSKIEHIRIQQGLDGLQKLVVQSLPASKHVKSCHPSKPVLENKLHNRDNEEFSSSCTELHLSWRAGSEDDEILFFTLEQIIPIKILKNAKQKGGLKMICRDPPTQSVPPMKPLGEFLVKGLEPDSFYEFRITAFNRHGPSKPCRQTFSTLPEKPKRPRIVDIISGGPLCTCVLSWGNNNQTRTTNTPVATLREGKGQHLELRNIDKEKKLKEEKKREVSKNRGRSMYQLVELKPSEKEGLIFDENNFNTVYVGGESQVEIVGLIPGSSYYFFVRALNGLSELSQPSSICTVHAPMKPPKVDWSLNRENPHEVRFKWNKFQVENSHANTITARGVLEDWGDTLNHWKEQVSKAYKNVYTLKLINTDNGKDISVKEQKIEHENNNSSKVEYLCTDLIPNTQYKALLKVESTTGNQSSMSPVFTTPWSSPIKFHTAPVSSSQPFLVSASSTELTYRWYSPSNGAYSYRVEAKSMEQTQEPKSEKRTNISPNYNEWTPVFTGKYNVGVISNLKPDSTYRVRVISLAKDGTSSVPSLPAQHKTLNLDEKIRLTPHNASKFFTLPCHREDLTLGDMILFTEAIKQENKSSGLRTMAGRVVVQQGKKVWIQVEWCSLSVQDRSSRASLTIPHGSRIQRSLREVFKLETQCGVYRTPWFDESARRVE